MSIVPYLPDGLGFHCFGSETGRVTSSSGLLRGSGPSNSAEKELKMYHKEWIKATNIITNKVTSCSAQDNVGAVD